MSTDVGDLAVRVKGRLVGRDAEVARIITGLTDGDIELLTICGAAGVGKTATATEVADQLESSGRHTAFVRLESAVTTTDLLLAVASAVALPAGGGSLRERLSELGDELWVVLDNCEHLVGQPHPVAVLRHACPAFRLLATSIRPLRVPGEHIEPLGPLPVPPPGATPEETVTSPAVELYLQRAAEASAEFDPTRAPLADVAELCRQVDGLPLGIELLAARVSTLPPSSAQSYLRTRSVIGLKQPRTGSPVTRRHQSLRDALGWTLDLVPADAAALLRRMSVLTGPLTLDQLAIVHGETTGVGAVGRVDSELLDLLADLVDARLVEVRQVNGEPAFTQLPLVRDFASELLDEHSERHVTEERRIDACLDLVRSSKRGIDLGVDPQAMVELTARESDLRSVVCQLVETGDVATGMELACPMAALVFRRGYDGFVANALARLIDLHTHGDRARPACPAPERLVVEAMLRHAQIQLLVERPAELDAARAQLSEAATRALALDDVDIRLFAQSLVIRSLPVTGDFAGAAAAVAGGLALAEQAGDQRMIARFSSWAGIVQVRLGDPDAALVLARRGVESAVASADAEGMIAAWLCLQGTQSERAQPLLARLPALEDLLGAARELQDQRSESILLRTAAAAAVVRREHVLAAAHVAECLRVGGRELRTEAQLSMTAVMLEAAVDRGDFATAIAFHGMLADQRELLVSAVPSAWIERYDAAVSRAYSGIGDDDGDRAFRDGAQTPVGLRADRVRDYADAVARTSDGTEGTAPADVPTPTELLTPREHEVLALLAAGASNKDIAHELGMAPKTVMHHSVAIYRKLEVRGRAEATAWAFRAGLVT